MIGSVLSPQVVPEPKGCAEADVESNVRTKQVGVMAFCSLTEPRKWHVYLSFALPCPLFLSFPLSFFSFIPLALFSFLVRERMRACVCGCVRLYMYVF